MLQEQFSFAIINFTRLSLRLPMNLQLLNPIATIDVIRAVLNIITNRLTSTVADRSW